MFLRDLSNNNGSAGLKAFSDPKTSAFYLKATEGLSFRDPWYPQYRTAAELKGKPSGAYLFLRYDEDGAAQAKFFLAYARLGHGDLQPVVDVETGSPAKSAKTALAALRTLKAAGFDPIMYTSTSWLPGLLATEPALKNFRVWNAEYGPIFHRLPGVRYIAWQFTDKMLVGRGPLSTDGSRLYVPNLEALEIRPKPVPPTPAPSPSPAPAPKPKQRKRRFATICGLLVVRGSRVAKWLHKYCGRLLGK